MLLALVIGKGEVVGIHVRGSIAVLRTGFVIVICGTQCIKKKKWSLCLKIKNFQMATAEY